MVEVFTLSHDGNKSLLGADGLPAFASIRAVDIEPVIDDLITVNRERIESLLQRTLHYTGDSLLQELEDMDDVLERNWSPVRHLHAVADNKQLRRSYRNCLTKLSDYTTWIGQNESLFHAFEAIAADPSFTSLSPARRKAVHNTLRDFRLSGVYLNARDKKRYSTIQKKLSKLQTRFSENVLDATRAWKKLITCKDVLCGLPDSAIESAAQNAKEEGKRGWLFTLDFPSYMPVMRYADSEDLRKEMYTAYVTRASEQFPGGTQWDNGEIMYDILKYRTEKARLLGFESYAHYSLVTKMAKDPKQVMRFLNDLSRCTHAAAQQEFSRLTKFAARVGQVKKLQAWNVEYYTQKLRQEKFGLSQEMLRPYFPVKQVIEGLFAVTRKLYGVNIKQRAGVETWHDDVMFFDIVNAAGRPQGGFYLDLYARKNKQGGAWMDECIVRRKTVEGIQHPVAYLNCNFTPPIGGKPPLLTHDEVITMFHEFGHGLHHLLSRVDCAGVSGINGVPWDAVELPSQFMENWCWEKEALDLFARHIDSGDRIDAVLYEKMRGDKVLHAGMDMARQLEYALFDFRLHLEFANREDMDIQTLLNAVREQVAVFDVPSFNRFQHSFSHIFAGGYAAGYYSYKWAEVLSSDAFSKFEENGIFDRKTGREFLRAILERGGSRDPMDLFVEFRGREPSIEPLLRHAGITA